MVNGERADQQNIQLQLQQELIDYHISQDVLKNYEINKTVLKCIERLKVAEEAFKIKQDQHDEYIENIKQLKKIFPFKLILKYQLLNFQLIEQRNKIIYQIQRGINGALCILISNKTKIQVNNNLAKTILQNQNYIKLIKDTIFSLYVQQKGLQLTNSIQIDEEYKQLIDKIEKEQYQINQTENVLTVKDQKYKVQGGDWKTKSWETIKNQIDYDQTIVDELNNLQYIQDYQISINQIKQLQQ